MKIALVQGENNFNIEDNFEKIKKDIVENRNVRCLIYPEAYLTGYTTDLSKTRPIKCDDKAFKDLKEFCIKYNVDVFVGYIEDCEEKYYLSYKHVGEICENYRKTHLGKKERKVFTEGDKLKLFHVYDFKIGVALCVESHFPEIAQTLTIMGADCLAFPFASPRVCGSRKDVWQRYLPARAYDNNVYVLAVNCWMENVKMNYSGGAVAVDPMGNIMKSNFEDYTELIVDINKDVVEERRKKDKINYISKRRKDLYL